MKIVIEHSSTKRQIDGAFNLCASREDIAELVCQLQAHLRREDWSYGWLTVHPPVRVQANTPPKHWDA